MIKLVQARIQLELLGELVTSRPAEVAGLDVTRITVTTTERMHTSGQSDRSATGVNNARVRMKHNGIDS